MVGCLSHGLRRPRLERQVSGNPHSAGQPSERSMISGPDRGNPCLLHPRVGHSVVSGESLAPEKRAVLTADVSSLCFPALLGPSGLS